MDISHPDQPKYETLDFPTGPLEAVKVEPELFVEEEHFIIPVPKQLTPLQTNLNQNVSKQKPPDLLLKN